MEQVVFHVQLLVQPAVLQQPTVQLVALTTQYQGESAPAPQGSTLVEQAAFHVQPLVHNVLAPPPTVQLVALITLFQEESVLAPQATSHLEPPVVHAPSLVLLVPQTQPLVLIVAPTTIYQEILAFVRVLIMIAELLVFSVTRPVQHAVPLHFVQDVQLTTCTMLELEHVLVQQ